MTLKQKIHNQYLQLILDKVNMLEQILDGLKESGSNETKSTAGDKHETALAMLQIEQANNRGQLQQALLQKSDFEKINPIHKSQKIMMGSLIKTNKGYFYMSVALGKILAEAIPVFAVSPQSPLGEKLMGLSAGDTIGINKNVYFIESVE